MKWEYVRYDEEKCDAVHLPKNDDLGEITGKVVINLAAYFDENPEERIALGWVKHIMYEKGDEQYPEWDKQTQFLTTTQRAIDEYTTEDVYYVTDKSEEQLLMEELRENGVGGTFIFYA